MATATKALDRAQKPRLIDRAREHWPEYVSEACGLAAFMVSASVFAVLLFHPMSSLAQVIEDPLLRRGLMGIAMGATLLAIIGSPMGQRSGAHLNPALTLMYLVLDKVHPWDAILYAIAQFSGGIAGIGVALLFIGLPLQHQSVRYVATVPGPQGAYVAFAAEAAISFVLFYTVLATSNHPRWAGFTRYAVATLVAIYIAVESPISGMSMNPARTFGSAAVGEIWTALWIYFVAPPLGMLAAAAVYRFTGRRRQVFCAKLHHHNTQRCIFRCNWPALNAE
jgi:aquaporin Z